MIPALVTPAVEYVKIDRAIIVQALTDRTTRGVMAGIVAIARATGAYVIAEHRSVRGVHGYLLQRPAEKIVAIADASESSSILRQAAARHRTSGADPIVLGVLGNEVTFAGQR